ncbi:MAG: hypothetical protein EXX96DRAFT_554167 [Benjaminiella poitrasii]|nr:MAG: hypothetical protein EXX96DRAFT_554167 [Benjaminiella poitrasii]
MSLLDSVLPIIEVKEGALPISSKLDSELLSKFLHEQARIEQLSQMSINKPNADRFLLEPITHKLFDIFNKDEGSVVNKENNNNITTVYSTNSDLSDKINLLSIGELKLLDCKDKEDNIDDLIPKESGLFLKLSEHKKRREVIQKEQLLPSTEASPTQDIQPVENGNLTVTAVSTPTLPLTTEVSAPVTGLQTVEAAVTADPTTVAEITSASTDTKNDISLYDNAFIDTNISDAANVDENTNSRVYAYPKQLIPIFATPRQQADSDKITSTALTQTDMFFQISFSKSVSELNFPSFISDISLKESWIHSGKLIFLKQLFEKLVNQDYVIAIVTHNMDDERMLISWIEEEFNFTCIRFSHHLASWKGEYGIFVKTSQSHNSKSTIAHSINASAHFIICLDVRVDRTNTVFEKIKKINKIEAMTGQVNDAQQNHPPTAWLVSLGSVEEGAFEYLKQHKTTVKAVSSKHAFKQFLLTGNTNKWPVYDKMDHKELSNLVANNISIWLSLNGRYANLQYQFRSTAQLPQSYYFANLKMPTQEDVTVAIDANADVDIEDMSISSGSEVLDDNELMEYIEKSMFPVYEIELRKTNTEELNSSLIKDTETKDKLLNEYQEEVNSLKRKYEASFLEVVEKYKRRAKEAFIH